MELITISILILTLFLLSAYICKWYNGVLNVTVDDVNGDNALLEILEYDKIRNNKYMIIKINRISK